jgi:hypothetical protein
MLRCQARCAGPNVRSEELRLYDERQGCTGKTVRYDVRMIEALGARWRIARSGGEL